ncbi:hypothetical protein CFAM422_010064 [Trichoderma lentiforme]|uniref:Uncharacterized protein n=1 Tax=Trichoderma lentiforme TaxID=1567552 RepID=A0A9P4X9H4_9HYPO|nr:hypothetical protein CFAM422_010064 [Trichoderma lentiforme]
MPETILRNDPRRLNASKHSCLGRPFRKSPDFPQRGAGRVSGGMIGQSGTPRSSGEYPGQDAENPDA